MYAMEYAKDLACQKSKCFILNLQEIFFEERSKQRNSGGRKVIGIPGSIRQVKDFGNLLEVE